MGQTLEHDAPTWIHFNKGKGKKVIVCHKCTDEWTHPHCIWSWLIELNVNDIYSLFMPHFISQWDYGQCWHFVRMLAALLLLFLHLRIIIMQTHCPEIDFPVVESKVMNRGKYQIKSFVSVSGIRFPQSLLNPLPPFLTSKKTATTYLFYPLSHPQILKSDIK